MPPPEPDFRKLSKRERIDVLMGTPGVTEEAARAALEANNWSVLYATRALRDAGTRRSPTTSNRET